MRNIICKMCRKIVENAFPSQIYCKKCSEKADRKRKGFWANGNKKSVAVTQKKHSSSLRPFFLDVRKERAIPKGTVDWIDDKKYSPNLDIGVRVVLPFDFNYSKNSVWRTGKTGHIYLRDEARQLKKDLAEMISNSGVKWRVNKVYLDILVRKPTMSGDAINFIDTIADGVKQGLGLDDNWFCIRKLDWEISKNHPEVVLGVFQQDFDIFYCSNCGIPQGRDGYNKNVHNRFGIAHPCKACNSLARSLRNKSKLS